MYKALIAGVLTLVCWLGIAAYGQAQTGSIRLESRVRQLELDLRRVRSQVSRLSNSQSGISSDPPSNPSTVPGLLGDPSLEEQFDNLAILAIELKQQVRELEGRVNQLESAP